MDISEIINLAEQYSFLFHEYEEDGILCGYEMESWTDGGVNMVHFIDCRLHNYPDGLTIPNILHELQEISDLFDPDDEVDKHRKDLHYRNAFSVRESIDDFEDYDSRLAEFVKAVRTAFSSIW